MCTYFGVDGVEADVEGAGNVNGSFFIFVLEVLILSENLISTSSLSTLQKYYVN